MALKHRTIDIEIDGKNLENRIIEPAVILRDHPDIRLVIDNKVFDHLLSRIREDGDVVFRFKATARGFMIETEAKVQVLGFDPADNGYFVVLLLL